MTSPVPRAFCRGDPSNLQRPHARSVCRGFCSASCSMGRDWQRLRDYRSFGARGFPQTSTMVATLKPPGSEQLGSSEHQQPSTRRETGREGCRILDIPAPRDGSVAYRHCSPWYKLPFSASTCPNICRPYFVVSAPFRWTGESELLPFEVLCGL